MDPQPPDLNREAVCGRDLSPEQAADLEEVLKVDPHRIDLRLRLLGYYSRRQHSSESAAASRSVHVLWIIENFPDFPEGLAAWVSLDPSLELEAYIRGRELWLSNVHDQSEDTRILSNAAHFFLLTERPRAIELLELAQQLEPSNQAWPRRLGHAYELGSIRNGEVIDPEECQKSLEAYLKALQLSRGMHRCANLKEVAQAYMWLGQIEPAEKHAEELLESCTGNSNGRSVRGRSLHFANTVLGQVALRRGDVQEAESRLLQAAGTPGSATLNSFGPSMILARELLEHGRTETVIQYLRLCREFWPREKLDTWIEDIRMGRTPDFGANLVY